MVNLKSNAWKFATVVLVVLLASSVAYNLGLFSVKSPNSQAEQTPEVYPDQPSYIVWRNGTNYYVKDAFGALAFGGVNTDASYLINLAISSLPENGGSILLRGTITLTSTVYINHNSVEIYGENIAGDLFFVRDNIYHGVSNKSATTIIADGITAFNVGSEGLVFGVTIKNLAITGNPSDAALSHDLYSNGCGINITTCDTLTISNVEVIGKYYGLYLSASGGTYKVIDIVSLENLRFAYNVYGFYSQSWVANVRINNIWGYVNQKGLLHAEPQYDWVINNVWSNADSWNSVNVLDAPIYIGTGRDVSLSHVAVEGAFGDTLCPVPLITLACSVVGSPEWTRAHISLSNVNLMSTASDAVRIVGSGGQVEIENMHVGTNGTRDFYGAIGAVNGSVISNENGAGIIVNVDKGFALSLQRFPSVNWFINCSMVEGIEGFNPVGNIRSVYAFNNAHGRLGLQGDSSVEPNTTYTVYGVPVYLNCTGGEGVDITVSSPDGTTCLSGLSTISMYLPVGWHVSFGAFSTEHEPTITVIGT
jgi:hypothetical protein